MSSVATGLIVSGVGALRFVLKEVEVSVAVFPEASETLTVTLYVVLSVRFASTEEGTKTLAWPELTVPV